MKAPRNKALALAVAGVVVAAGAVAVDLPAWANTNKGKTASSKTVKGKSGATKASVKASTTTPAPTPADDHDGDGDGGRGHGFGPGDPQALTAVLADLVSKGTITQAQSDAITAALQAKRDAAQQAEDTFHSKIAAIFADALGLSVDEFNAKRASHTLPEPTAAQWTQINTKINELRTSLGLPTGQVGPAGAPGMHGDGPGFGGRGDGDGDGPRFDAGTTGTGQSLGMRGHHGGRGF